MTYGKQANRFYVNSAQNLPRDKVDEQFGRESKGDGSVALGYIETITNGAELIGKWAIVSYIEESLLRAEEENLLPPGEVRFAQRHAAHRQAQRIMLGFAFPTAQGLPYISKAELDGYLDARKAAIRKGQLQRAAALKRCPWVWHLSGPRSND